MNTTLTETPDFTSEAAKKAGIVILKPEGKKNSQKAPKRDDLEVLAESNKRSEELAALELVIEKGLQPFWQTGVALAKIRSEKLWAPKYKSWPKYLEERWGFRGPRASQLICSGKVVDLITMVNKSPVPKSERVVRPLVPLLNVPAADLKGLSDEEVAKVIAERETLVVRIYAAATEASGNKEPTGKEVEKQVQILAPARMSKPPVETAPEELLVDPRIRDRFMKYWALFWYNLQGEDSATIWDLIAEQEGCPPPDITAGQTAEMFAGGSADPVEKVTPAIEALQEIAKEGVVPDGAADPGAVLGGTEAAEAAQPEQEAPEPTPTAWEQMDLIQVPSSVKPGSEAVTEKPEVVPPAPARKPNKIGTARETTPRRRNVLVSRAM